MTPRDDLRALAERIRDAAAQHLPAGHTEARALCEERGIGHRTTFAYVSVRVGQWHVTAFDTVGEHDAERAVRQCVAALQSCLAARAEWLRAHLAATEAALAVVRERVTP